MSGSIFDVKTFGALGDGKTDDTAAFQRALDAIEALSPETDSHGRVISPAGAVLHIPFGKYLLNKTLHIRRQMIIQGVSGAGDQAGTRLVFAPDIDGIVIERQDIPTVNPFGFQLGDWTVIRDVAIWSDGQHIFSRQPNPAVNEDEPISASSAHINHQPLHGHGVVLMSRARLVNCNIEGFHYDGIYIDTVDLFKNANNFEIHNCRIKTNGRHGIFVCGGNNSNAGRIIGVDCSNNAAWGIYDRSFLGNTYVGCHSADNGHYATDVLCLLVDPNTPDITYAGTGDSGFYRATDGGRNWAAFNRGLSVGGFNAKVSALALDATGVLYMGTLDAGVLRRDPPVWMPTTADWTAINQGLSNLTVQALVIADKPTILYAGTRGGLFRSTDSGQNWNTPVLANQNVQALALGRGKPDTLYAGTPGGVFISTDGGQNWNAPGLTNQNVKALAFSPKTRKPIIYAGTTSGVFISTDGGKTWSLSLPNQRVAALVIDPQTSITIYAGTDAGIFKSLDSGETWTASSNGLATLDVRALGIDPQTPTTIYAGTHPKAGFDALKNLGGVYRSIDGGATWHGGFDNPRNPDPENASRTFYGGGYKTTQTLASNVMVGCYSEGDQGNGNELFSPTLVLGGKLGGGFNPITNAGIVNERGIINLPLLSSVVHKVRTIVRRANSILPRNSPDTYSILIDDEIILVNLANGFMVLVLQAAKAVSGQQFVIKRIDPELTDPANPPSSYTSLGVHIQVLGGGLIDTEPVVKLTQPNTGIALIANGDANNYQIISTIGKIRPERTPYSTDHRISISDYIVGVDTSTKALTMTLPNPLAIADGAVLIIKDEKNNASSHPITIKRNASEKINGVAMDLTINTNSGSVRLYTDRANWFTV